MKIFLAVGLIFLSIIFFSCKENAANGSSEIQSVPFLAGKESIYQFTYTADSLGKIIYNGKDSISIKIVSDNISIGNYNNVILLEGKSFFRNNATAKVWYMAARDSLTEVAYTNAGALPVVMPKLQRLSVNYSDLSLPYTVKNFLLQKHILGDSLQWREDPRVVYKFPLSVGKEWISFRYPFFQKRTVAGYEFIKVQAGSFNCAKIKTDLYFNDTKDTSIVWFDYVASEGLILRTIQFSGLITSEIGPDESYMGNSFERTELISIK